MEKRLLVGSHKPMSKDDLSGHFTYNNDVDCCIPTRLCQNSTLRRTLPFHWVGMVQVSTKTLEADAPTVAGNDKTTAPKKSPLSGLSCLQTSAGSSQVIPHDEILSFVLRGQSSGHGRAGIPSLHSRVHTTTRFITIAWDSLYLSSHLL